MLAESENEVHIICDWYFLLSAYVKNISKVVFLTIERNKPSDSCNWFTPESALKSNSFPLGKMYPVRGKIIWDHLQLYHFLLPANPVLKVTFLLILAEIRWLSQKNVAWQVEMLYINCFYIPWKCSDDLEFGIKTIGIISDPKL